MAAIFWGLAQSSSAALSTGEATPEGIVMMKGPVFALALFTQLIACGSDQAAVPSDTPGTTPQPAQYPRAMPSSSLDDKRLIGYWEAECASSAQQSQRWTFLLDPSKAVLEKKVFRDGQCNEAAYTLRYYLNYSSEGEILNASLWEVHTNIQANDRLSQLFDLQTCRLPQVRDEIWYDLTGTACAMNHETVSIDRGSPVLATAYDFTWDLRLVMTLDGRTQLKFQRMD